MTQPQILYIEDHPASRRVMQLLLLDLLDYTELTLLEDTQSVIQRLEMSGKAFDIIFLDLNLRPHDGYATCTLLRAHSQFGHARIICLTAEASPTEMRKMRDTGFDGMIGKPLSHTTFPEQIERILAGEAVWEAL